MKGINDLWTTNPILANMLKNPDDGYKIASQPRTTGDGYYESCVLDPENNRIEIVE